MHELNDKEREILRSMHQDTGAGQGLREHDREMEERESVPMGDTLRRRFTENAEQFDALMSEMLNENTQLRAERDICKVALKEIASPTQSDNLLWWQERARKALAECGE